MPFHTSVNALDGLYLSKTLVLSTDMVRILDTVRRGETGSWQDLFREIIGDVKLS